MLDELDELLSGLMASNRVNSSVQLRARLLPKRKYTGRKLARPVLQVHSLVLCHGNGMYALQCPLRYSLEKVLKPSTCTATMLRFSLSQLNAGHEICVPICGFSQKFKTPRMTACR